MTCKTFEKTMGFIRVTDDAHERQYRAVCMPNDCIWLYVSKRDVDAPSTERQWQVVEIDWDAAQFVAGQLLRCATGIAFNGCQESA